MKPISYARHRFPPQVIRQAVWLYLRFTLAGPRDRHLRGRTDLDRVASRKLIRRGLRGVKLVISDAHEGIKAAVSKVLSATWQRCRVHFQRNVPAHAGKSGRRAVSAFIATAFAQDTAKAAFQQPVRRPRAATEVSRPAACDRAPLGPADAFGSPPRSRTAAYPRILPRAAIAVCRARPPGRPCALAKLPGPPARPPSTARGSEPNRSGNRS